MKFRSRILLVALSFMSLQLLAQEATEEVPQGWPIVERCIGEPTNPPVDWSFEGTILATGWAGIHGINAEWDTPYILIFRDDWFVDPYGSNFSPNQEWFAVIQYDIIPNFPRSHVATYGIRVYSIANPDISYFYEITDSTENIDLFWADNVHIIFWDYENAYRFNVFTGESEIYSGEFSDTVVVAPNLSFAAIYVYRQWIFEDLETHRTIFTIDQESDFFDNLSISPDSELIAFYKTENINEEQYTRTGSLLLLNRRGELVDTIFTQTEYLRVPFSYIAHGWSNDGQYYAFMPYHTDMSRDGILYIADIQEQIVINTCLSIDGYAGLRWSPTENKLVVGYPEAGQQPLQILDLDLWQTYNTNQYHRLGNIMIWRAD